MRASTVGPVRAAPGGADAEHRLFTLAEAAAITGRNGELLRRWCASGRIACQRLGRDWLVEGRELSRIERMPRRGMTADRAPRVDDARVLNDALRRDLESCLARGERVRAIAVGVEGAALIVSDRNVYVARDGVLVQTPSRRRPAVWPLDRLRRVQLDLGTSTGVLVVTPSDPEDRALTLLLARTQFARATAAADVLRDLLASPSEGPPDGTA